MYTYFIQYWVLDPNVPPIPAHAVLKFEHVIRNEVDVSLMRNKIGDWANEDPDWIVIANFFIIDVPSLAEQEGLVRPGTFS